MISSVSGMLRSTPAPSPPSASIQFDPRSLPTRSIRNRSGTPVHSLVLINPCVFCTVRFSSAFFQSSHPLPVHSMKWTRETDGMAWRSSTQNERFLRHAMDQKPVLGGIQIWHARVTALIVQVRWRDDTHQLVQRRLGVDRVARVDIADSRAGLWDTTDLDIFRSLAAPAQDVPRLARRHIRKRLRQAVSRGGRHCDTCGDGRQDPSAGYAISL